MSKANQPGRPPLKSGERSVVVTMRLTTEQRDKLAALGGAAWVRAMIEMAKKMTFEDFLIFYTGRDIEYHRRNKTAGVEFGRACWDMAQQVAREQAKKIPPEQGSTGGQEAAPGEGGGGATSAGGGRPGEVVM